MQRRKLSTSKQGRTLKGGAGIKCGSIPIRTLTLASPWHWYDVDVPQRLTKIRTGPSQLPTVHTMWWLVSHTIICSSPGSFIFAELREALHITLEICIIISLCLVLSKRSKGDSLQGRAHAAASSSKRSKRGFDGHTQPRNRAMTKRAPPCCAGARSSSAGRR